MTCISPVNSNEQIADLRRLFHRRHFETVHRRFQGAHGIDFGNDNLGAHAAGASGHAFAAPTVAGDDNAFAGDQHVGGANHAVDGGLARAVAIIE